MMRSSHLGRMQTSRLRPRPRLPVPPLDVTINRYLDSLEPYILDIATKEGCTPDDVRAKRKLWANDFTKPGGLGVRLQDRLKGTLSIYPNSQTYHSFQILIAFLPIIGSTTLSGYLRPITNGELRY